MIDAARRVFTTRGYYAATLEEVAREAGYSTGAVYSNFRGKEELFLALAETELQNRIAEIRAVADAVKRGEPAAPAAAAQFRAFLEQQPRWPLLMYEFWSHGVRNPGLRQALQKRRQALRDALAETLESVSAHLGLRLRFPATELAAVLSATMGGIALQRAAEPDVVSDQLVREFVGALFNASLIEESS